MQSRLARSACTGVTLKKRRPVKTVENILRRKYSNPFSRHIPVQTLCARRGCKKQHEPSLEFLLKWLV